MTVQELSLDGEHASSLNQSDVEARYNDGSAAIESITSSFGAEDWLAPACGEWSASDTARHLVGVADWYHDWLERALDGEATPPFLEREFRGAQCRNRGGATRARRANGCRSIRRTLQRGSRSSLEGMGSSLRVSSRDRHRWSPCRNCRDRMAPSCMGPHRWPGRTSSTCVSSWSVQGRRGSDGGGERRTAGSAPRPRHSAGSHAVTMADDPEAVRAVVTRSISVVRGCEHPAKDPAFDSLPAGAGPHRKHAP